MPIAPGSVRVSSVAVLLVAATLVSGAGVPPAAAQVIAPDSAPATTQDQAPPADDDEFFDRDLYEPPIGPFVVDARASLTFFNPGTILPGNLGLRMADVPGKALGFDLAAQVYVFRWKAVTFGLGGSFHRSRAQQHIVEDLEEGIIGGPPVEIEYRTLVPQLSLNFGTGNGWSYVSGGFSPTRLSILVDGTERQFRTTRTLNYGGGARWFTKDHLAASFDVRFYVMSPLPQDGELIGLPRQTLVMISVGVSFK